MPFPPSGEKKAGADLRDGIVPRNDKTKVDRAKELVVHVATKGPLDGISGDYHRCPGQFERTEQTYALRRSTLSPGAAGPSQKQQRREQSALARGCLNRETEIAEDQVLGNRLACVQQALNGLRGRACLATVKADRGVH